ncbi:Membrane spanning protein [Desulfosporosinus sp. I2]|uniref:TVP38/TMEM64 family protein n=1 Tax=Desulfosporosinus sp. I2 TaxID=1617025 RepID=UPI0005ED804A|nr:VTT domain-containing protein [Desulfosporosinus sp. I2]KJR48840.1 Membrane spanning protein [Desulfosporosinus sp. I2]
MGKKYFSLLTLVISLTFVVLLYPKLQHPEAFQAFVTQWGWIGIIIDLFIIILLALFPVVPFVLIAGVNTLLYGWVGGFLLSLSGSLLGASVGFWLARTLGQTWAQPKIGKLGKWGILIEGNSFLIILLSRLIPVLPAAAVNYAAGLSLMTFPKFLLASLIGKIPMILWESWVGHYFWQVRHHPERLLLALAIGVLLLGLISLYWRVTFKRLKSPEP